MNGQRTPWIRLSMPGMFGVSGVHGVYGHGATMSRCASRYVNRDRSLGASRGLRLCTMLAILVGIPACCAPKAQAQRAQAQQTQKPVAYVPVGAATISGSLEVTGDRAAIGSHATITAGESTVPITLTRGGQILVCRSTSVQLSTDSSLGPDARPGDDAIMLALDQGALEEHDTPGKYSDVILTPDLRILISAPGKADLTLHVSSNGDTCIGNRGANAPYVTVTNLFSGGVYRVQPNQRVLLEGGSTSSVVDDESEPCGCPPPANAPETQAEPLGLGFGHGTRHQKPKPLTQAEKENPFPLAESEGLAPKPALPTTPAVPEGQIATEVETPITFNSAEPAPPPAPKARTAESAENVAGPSTEQRPKHPKHRHRGGFFTDLGHFFSHLFGHR